jgi:hypothetical protein
MPEIYEVTATTLNLRASPLINATNIIGRLGQGERVQKIGQPSSDWLHVQNSHASGFAAARFLERVNVEVTVVPTPVTAQFIPPQVNFLPKPNSRLDSVEQRHCPLNGMRARPRVAGMSDEERCRDLHAIVQMLDVANSPRYLPTIKHTYCNIYAYDVCHLAGVYLPRVWWMSKALIDISRGLDPGVVYGKTVSELTANALFDWLSEWGDEFGWQRCATVNELQDAANRGSLGVICAQRKQLSTSGHIVVVLPETPAHPADRRGPALLPLQSQAGANNKQYFTNQWWIDRGFQFRAVGFWTHP